MCLYFFLRTICSQMSTKEMKIVTAGKVNITTERPDQNVSSKCFVITIKLIAVALQLLDVK